MKKNDKKHKSKKEIIQQTLQEFLNLSWEEKLNIDTDPSMDNSPLFLLLEKENNLEENV